MRLVHDGISNDVGRNLDAHPLKSKLQLANHLLAIPLIGFLQTLIVEQFRDGKLDKQIPARHPIIEALIYRKPWLVDVFLLVHRSRVLSIRHVAIMPVRERWSGLPKVQRGRKEVGIRNPEGRIFNFQGYTVEHGLIG
jgi:hypothetical protein